MCLGLTLTWIVKPLVHVLGYEHPWLGLRLTHQSGLLIVNVSLGRQASSYTLLESLPIPEKTPT